MCLSTNLPMINLQFLELKLKLNKVKDNYFESNSAKIRSQKYQNSVTVA